MENIETNKESLNNTLDVILNSLDRLCDNAKDSIKQESNDTEGKNSWLDCFATQVLKAQLIIAKNASKEKFIQISEIISKGPFGSEEINNMKNKFRDNPSEEIQNDLIEKFKKYIFQIMIDHF